MKHLQRKLLLLVALWGGATFSGLYGSSRLHFSGRTSAINLKSGSKFTVGTAITNFKGSLIKDSNATIEGSLITFEDGTFEDSNNKIRLNGSLNPTTNQVTLGGDKIMRAEQGLVLNGVSIGGTGNRLEGSPVFTEAIEFDANATLTLSIQNSLSQNIQFDSGGNNTLRLESDLNLVDDVTIVNSGTIDVNGRKFSFGGKPLTLTNNIFWHNAGDITFWNKINLSSTWFFEDESTINGNGNVVDVSGGGKFDIYGSTTLHVADTVILGATDSTFIFRDPGATIRLSNVTIQIDGNITSTNGMFYIDGPTTFVMHNHNWTFNTDSKLTIDSVSLWLDKAGESTIGELIFGGADNYSFVNSGTYLEEGSGGALEDWVEATSEAVVSLDSRIDTAETNITNNDTGIAQNSEAILVLDSRVDTAESDIDTNTSNISTNQGSISTNQTNISTNATNIANNDTFVKFVHGPQDYILSSNTTLTVDLWLSNDHVFTIDSNMDLSGDNHAITFAKDNNGVFSLGSNSLTFKNIVLKDFFPPAVSLTTGSVTFGDGTKIETSENISLESSNYTMSFDGFVEMNCFGNEFDISQVEHAMDIQPGSTLCISNAKIKGLGGLNASRANNLKCIGPDSTLTLSNCELILSNNYTFSEGFLNLYQDNKITGTKTFAYQSPQVATVQTQSKLLIDRDVTFSYDSTAASKEKFVLEDGTSVLHLNGCTLYSTHTGLKLDTGRMIIEDLVTVQNEASNQAEAMELSEDMEIDVLSGAIFDVVEGVVSYN